MASEPSTDFLPISPLVTLASFSGWIGDHFDLRSLGAAQESAQLIEATAIQGALPSSTDGRVSFRFTFRVRHDWAPRQQIFNVVHSKQGELGGIFLVPVAKDSRGILLEGIFNFI